MTKYWQVDQVNNNISEIKKFARDLMCVAKQYHFEPLSRYAEQLLAQISAFDVEGIKVSLEGFPFSKEICRKPCLLVRSEVVPDGM
jgi:hypothetical protein